jgi:hypothetical protein
MKKWVSEVARTRHTSRSAPCKGAELYCTEGKCASGHRQGGCMACSHMAAECRSKILLRKESGLGGGARLPVPEPKRLLHERACGHAGAQAVHVGEPDRARLAVERAVPQACSAPAERASKCKPAWGAHATTQHSSPFIARLTGPGATCSTFPSYRSGCTHVSCGAGVMPRVAVSSMPSM